MGKSATIIESAETLLLFSYETPVAYVNKTTKEVFVTDTKHSRTTDRQIKKFFREQVIGVYLAAFNPKVITQDELNSKFPLSIKGL